MSVTVRELARLVQGEVVGDGERQIEGAGPVEEAAAGQITFVEDARYLKILEQSRAAAVVLPHPLTAPSGMSAIRVADPLAAFLTIFQHLKGPVPSTPPGVDPRAVIHPSARIGPGAAIGPFVCIEEGVELGARCRLFAGVSIGRGCRLGDDVVLHPHVVLYEGCRLGDRVVVHANAVLGADGFGYRPQGGRHVKVPQLGGVQIGDDVEIGACATIDRGTFQPTRIGAGTKIDNLVQVAHNCKIGRHNLLVSQCGIAGSSSTGDYVVIAGQAGITDHAHLGDQVVVGAQAGVTKDVPAGQCVLGAPARPEREVKVMVLTLEKLPELRREVKQIKQKLGMA